MSTRSIIARPTADGFAGRYVHFDGHPHTRVPILLTAIQEHFTLDTKAAARFYVDDHPAGWEELGTDFTTLPGSNDASADANRCYCHGDCADEPWQFTQDTIDPVWHEWVYVLRPDGLQIIRSDWRKCTQQWASHLLPWNTNPYGQLPDTPALTAL